jgi:prepilin-type N-terminal cleavage/methylation domain-containing protein
VNPARRRAGFTLTEILMATGILGIGLTMVASVFPVALDQSRRSQEQTMAALSARSVAAIIRARRDRVTKWLRVTSANAKDKTVEMTSESSTVDSDAAPFDLRNHNPNIFLYYNNPKRSYTRGAYNIWTTGGYVPVIFATPIATQVTSTAPGVSYGPWRLTIVIYKATGMQPFGLNPDDTATYLKNWVTAKGSGYPWRGGAGTYILDWTGPTPTTTTTTNFRGEAFLVDKVVPNSASPGDPTMDKIVLCTYAYGDPVRTGAAGAVSYETLLNWISLPGAVAVYHTILGD